MWNRTLFMTLALLTVGAFAVAGCSDDDSGAICGNDLVEEGESCDGASLDGMSCTTLPGDFTGGTLTCADNCTFDTSECTSGPAECGNDVQETGEDCDGADLGGSDCADVGNYVGGTLGCTAACVYDTSQCEVDPNCGNLAIDAGEDCDSTNLAGQTCASIPGTWTGGVLACAADCTWDESACTLGGDAVQQIIDARAAADGTGLTLPIEGAWVTYVKAAVGTDVAGFFLQASVAGPALFVAVDPATLTPQPVVGDTVTLTVTTMATVNLMRQATEITGFSVTASGYDVTALAQEVSAATDLVSNVDDYEVEVITVTGTIASPFNYAGPGHSSARFETAGIVGDADLRLRVPDTILPVVGLDQDCVVLVQYTPLWRYDAQAQVSIWATQDASLISCPAPEVLSAEATINATTVVVTISRPVDPASVLADGSQFTFTGGLTASAATATGNEITVTTSPQTPALVYTVTVAQTVTDILGTGMAGPPNNQADFTGYVLNLCGNSTLDGGEECDDGNRDSYDGCSNTCQDDADHLLISELAVTPTAGEFVELYNPTANAIALDDVYLADYNTYYEITQGTAPSQNSDFAAHFPAGTSIPAGGFLVVSIRTATEFNTTYGFFPDFDLSATDTNAPALIGNIGGNAGLTNNTEMVVLFTWDGASDLVQDVDYVVWGANATSGMDKTAVNVGSGTYLADTATSLQVPAVSPGGGQSLERCDTSEGAEVAAGGNGLTGNNETSEDFSATFVVSTSPSPGVAPAAGTCGP